MSDNLQKAYSELIKLAAEMFRHEGEPSIYIGEMEFCKTTPFKDKIRRSRDNEKSHNLSHNRAHRIKAIADNLRSQLSK